MTIKYPYRKGRFIVQAHLQAVEYKSINQAKKANRGNCNPSVKGKG